MVSKNNCFFCAVAKCFIISLLNEQYVTTTNSRRWRGNEVGNTCIDTIKTLQKVDSCPEKDTNYQERSKEKKCDSYPQCEGEPLTYHCARYKEYLVEVCTPTGFIRGKCCAMYEDGIGRVIEDYSRECVSCPFKYRSNDSFKYTECNALDKLVFPKDVPKIAMQNTDLTETTSPLFLQQTVKHVQRSSEPRFATSETRTTAIFKSEKYQPTRPPVPTPVLRRHAKDEGTFIHAFIHVPVVLSIGAFLAILAFEKDTDPSKFYVRLA